MTATVVSDRVRVVATGLLELDEEGGRLARDNRLQYDGASFLPGQQLTVRAADVSALAAAGQVQVLDELPAVDFWAVDRLLRVEPGPAQPRASGPSAGALRIVSGTGFDPGAAAYRLHNAVTEHTPHGTAFVRYLTAKNNPHDCPAQWNGSAVTQQPMVRALLYEADVVHCHIDPCLTRNVGLPARPRAGQVVIRHYHGTQFTGSSTVTPAAQQLPVKNAAADDAAGYVLVGARLQLCALRPDRMQWLPITVPVERYAAMRPVQGYRVPTAAEPFRVAHSPTRRRLKGTDQFLAACARLSARGVPVEPVLIENLSHLEALRLKATANACFDAFALGLQGSGLEAAAMGQPVIAGDAYVRELHEREFGYCPYTFADNERSLEQVIERLALDQSYYDAERVRVGDYCLRFHDYPRVAERYDRIIREAIACP